MRFTFDTNILVYALVRQDNEKHRSARNLLRVETPDFTQKDSSAAR